MAEKQLKRINPDRISRNKDNPRLIFRQDELDSLAASIRRVGILVPLAVYEGLGTHRYVLIDGERRWRCARKLNLPEVPVIIEPKPTRLENILRMFDIHNVRVHWDLLAISLKLQEIQQLLDQDKKPSSSKDLAAVTGLSISTVRRAFDLLSLPPRYLRLLRRELEKPKPEQQFSEDLFIEMMKAFRVVERYAPEAAGDLSQKKLISVFFNKYRDDVIRNVVAFRQISKIARGEKLGVPKRVIVLAIRRLIDEPTYPIEQAYGESVRFAYEERELLTSIAGLTEKLSQFEGTGSLPPELATPLAKLRATIKRILERSA